MTFEPTVAGMDAIHTIPKTRLRLSWVCYIFSVYSLKYSADAFIMTSPRTNINFRSIGFPPFHNTKYSPEPATSVLALAPNSESSPASFLRSLKLEERFDRWKYMQEFLDDFDIEDGEIQQVLYAVLDRYAQKTMSHDNLDNNDNDDDTGSRRIATPAQKEIVKDLLDAFSDAQSIPAMLDETVLHQVEQLLPDPQEDEDALKGGWDVLMELHGRESVKVNEQAGTARWKSIAIVARVMLHYDFLQEGIRSSSPESEQ